MKQLRSALICHAGDELNEVGLAQWMESFSELKLIIRIHEPRSRLWRRLRREYKRVGAIRMLDILAFRFVHTLKSRRAIANWKTKTIERLRRDYPSSPSPFIVDVPNANDPVAVAALDRESIDFAIARCKQLLNPRVFELPKHGVFVLHPGICPDYRNAHGGFWAIAQGDDENVGSTLLRIDRGIDTGPVFGYYRVAFDALSESPFVIQNRTLFENLEQVRKDLIEVINGARVAVDTSGRRSAEWGQPWLSAWLTYRSRWGARRRSRP